MLLSVHRKPGGRFYLQRTNTDSTEQYYYRHKLRWTLYTPGGLRVRYRLDVNTHTHRHTHTHTHTGTHRHTHGIPRTHMSIND